MSPNCHTQTEEQQESSSLYLPKPKDRQRGSDPILCSCDQYLFDLEHNIATLDRQLRGRPHVTSVLSNKAEDLITDVNILTAIITSM